MLLPARAQAARQEQLVEMTKSWLLLATTLIPACGGNAGEFIRRTAPIVALAHVRVIDGTGVAYDPERLVASAAGTLGESTPGELFTLPVIILIIGLGLLAAWRATQSLRRPRLAAAA
jgi:hypothetical protein